MHGGSGSRRPDWPPEPDMVRMGHGFPDGLDRVGALGNAVVPAVAELVARRMLPDPTAP